MEAYSTGHTESLRLNVPDSFNWMMSLAGLGFKIEEVHLKMLTALFVIIPAHYLNTEICDLMQIFFRCTLTGCETLKKLYEMILYYILRSFD